MKLIYRPLILALGFTMLLVCGTQQPKAGSSESDFLTLEKFCENPDMHVGKDTLLMGEVFGVCPYEPCSLMLKCGDGNDYDNELMVRLTPKKGVVLDSALCNKLVLAAGKLHRVAIDSVELCRLESEVATIEDQAEKAMQEKIVGKYKRIYAECRKKGLNFSAIYYLATDSIKEYAQKIRKISL